MLNKSRRLMLPALFVVFVSCSGVQRRSDNTIDSSAYQQAVSLGVYIVPNDTNQLSVAFVPQGSAVSGVLQTGDLIGAVDGTAVLTRSGLLEEIRKAANNDKVRLTVKRGEQVLQVYVKLQKTPVRKDLYAVFEQLARNEDIRLTIVVDQISNMLVTDPLELKDWRSMLEDQLLTSLEGDYLNAFQYDPKFHLIDRNRVAEVLKELRFGMTGLVSRAQTQEMGKFLGATHIVFAEFSRLKKESLYKDVLSIRLIEIQTDKVLASLSVTKEK